MNETGFIKLHRSIQSWEWFSDAVTFRVFIYLLLNAQWESSRFRGHEVPKGSLVASYGSIAENLNISVQNVRTAINHLKSTGEITTKSTNKFTIISVANWEKYQCCDEEINKQTNKPANNQLTNNQQTTNNIKEYKNIKKLRKEEYYTSQSQNGRNLDFLKQLERESKS